MRFNPYVESVKILQDENYSIGEIMTILEDANSPVTRKYHEKLYTDIINKKHIDFGSISKSKGNITEYDGYKNMMETLSVIKALAEDCKATNVLDYVNIVLEATHNITTLSPTYQKGFTFKSDYVMLEYNTYVFFCIEATTALIYSYVDYQIKPEKQIKDMVIKNTKIRADEFYFEQLRKFNNVYKHNASGYRKLLEKMCTEEKDNFIGTTTLIGIGTVMAVALSIVPITREIIYQIYNFRGRLSDHLELQATFLEMNKACVEANQTFTAEKRNKVIQKQEKLAKHMRSLSDIIKVKSAQSILDSKRDVQKNNGMMTIDSLKDEISNSPFELF